ncbi:MAG TPA: metallophosphoesterase [Casimicrobiaceae bacterium]|nr:metallophosphoesterase [Casimicrobiaceae bacterium]
MTRVLQISDTHLSLTKQHFQANWKPLRDWVLRQHADLVVHTGDVTVDGADVEQDLRDVAQMMQSLQVPVLTVPGNHDVGDARNPHQPVNGERLARWRRYFGPDWWSHDLEKWRLIGLDAMLFDSGHPDEARQLAWLDQTLETVGERKLAWFMHRPLFIESPDEGDTGYWSVKPKPRAKLLDLIEQHDVAVVASGHLHKWHDAQVGGCRYVWGPSSGFLVGPDNQPDIPGEKLLGAVVYEFDGADVAIAVEDVPGLRALWIDDVIHEVYPPHRAA